LSEDVSEGLGDIESLADEWQKTLA
jgi:hypothetical protein